MFSPSLFLESSKIFALSLFFSPRFVYVFTTHTHTHTTHSAEKLKCLLHYFFKTSKRAPPPSSRGVGGGEGREGDYGGGGGGVGHALGGGQRMSQGSQQVTRLPVHGKRPANAKH
jgi:hypothetical protein